MKIAAAAAGRPDACVGRGGWSPARWAPPVGRPVPAPSRGCPAAAAALLPSRRAQGCVLRFSRCLAAHSGAPGDVCCGHRPFGSRAASSSRASDRRSALPAPSGSSRSTSSHSSSSGSSSRRRGPRGPLAAAAAAASPAVSGVAGYTLEQVMDHMRPLFDLGDVTEVEVTGRGKHLGVPVAWQMQFSTSGAFVESVQSEYLNYCWSFDGHPSSRCVEVDGTGNGRVLDLDDHEMLVLGMLARTGLWLRDDVAARLGLARWLVPLAAGKQEAVEIQPIFTVASEYPATAGPPAIFQAAMAGLIGGHGTGPLSPPPTATSASGFSAAALGATPASLGHSGDGAAASAHSSSGSGGGGGAHSSSSSSSSSAGQQEVGVCMRLATGRMVMRLRVVPGSWLPVSYSQSLCGSGELWRYEDWRPAQRLAQGLDRRPLPPTYHWPCRFEHNVAGGGDYSYEAQRVQAAAAAGSARPAGHVARWSRGRYAGPTWCTELSDMLRLGPGQGRIPFRCSSAGPRPGAAVVGAAAAATAASEAAAAPAPAGAAGAAAAVGAAQTDDAVVERRVPAFRTSLGHVLLQVSVNSHEPVWMILDTGASGFVLSHKLTLGAKHVEGDGAAVAGVNGKATTSFLWADSIEVGGWRLMRQSMMCMDISNIIQHFHRPVQGIVGYELFRRLVVVLPDKQERVAQREEALALLQAQDGSALLPGPPPRPEPPAAAAAGGARRPPSASASASASALQDAAARVGAAGSGREAAGDAARRNAAAAPTAAATATRKRPAPGSGGGAGGAGGEAARYLRSLHRSEPLLLGLHHPGYVPVDPGLCWVPLHMVSGLPHLPVTFCTPQGRVVSCLLMVDTGAGGVELIFNSRAAHELGLPMTSDAKHSRTVKGVGSAGERAPRTLDAVLPWVQLGASTSRAAEDGRASDAGWVAAQACQGRLVRFTGVTALYSSSGGLDISLYSAGIICAGFLDRMRVVLDYPRQRFGFVPRADDPATLLLDA